MPPTTSERLSERFGLLIAANQYTRSLISLTGQPVARQVIDPTKLTNHAQIVRTTFHLDGLSPDIYLVHAISADGRERFVERTIVR